MMNRRKRPAGGLNRPVKPRCVSKDGRWPIGSSAGLSGRCFRTFHFCHPSRNRSSQRDDPWSGGTYA
jgi:hypothetical protein